MELRRSRAKIFISIAIVIALIVAIGLAIFFYMRYTEIRDNPETVSQETVERLQSKVGELYATLPGDEEPTVAEVSDKEKLREQPFFEHAENGDYILIYPNARIAVLYREDAHKLINVGPIAIEDQQNGNSEGDAAASETASEAPEGRPAEE